MKDFLTKLSKRAGEGILEVYGRDFEVTEKADSSPLTEADQVSNEIIVQALQDEFPDIPIISEETATVPYEERKSWQKYWLVDPLDGTKEFLKRNGEFTVNIALVESGAPSVGVVYQPTTGVTYFGSQNGGAERIDAEREEKLAQPSEHYSVKDHVRVIASRSHLTPEVSAFVQDLEASDKSVELINAGSSLKLCLVAEGKADVYPRLGPTMEWDTAAAQCVVEAAGRRVLDWQTKQPLAYNKEDLLNPWFIVE